MPENQQDPSPTHESRLGTLERQVRNLRIAVVIVVIYFVYEAFLSLSITESITDSPEQLSSHHKPPLPSSVTETVELDR